ncbi:YjbH domain-containing protein [Flavobacteriaceae bacterium]|nr:YjbH domain-containing protein [Flavobacteriaceae bacterium]
MPSARMLDDGKVIIGAAYIPKPYFQIYNRKINPGLNSYITCGILPFLEIMFRYTHELIIPVNTKIEYFPDRMLKILARFFKEKKYFPATVFGLQDISAL